MKEVDNPKTQISLEEAREIDSELEEGDSIEMTIPVESLGDLPPTLRKVPSIRSSDPRTYENPGRVLGENRRTGFRSYSENGQ
jgi:hypothetical protein